MLKLKFKNTVFVRTALAASACLIIGLPGPAFGADSTQITYLANLSQTEADAMVNRLFVQASSGEVKYSELVQPSKDSIAALGVQALPRMLARLNSRDARERWTVSDIFRQLGTLATDSLLSYLTSENKWVLLNVGRCLEQIKDTVSTLPCLPLLDHSRYPVRSQFAATLGKNGDPRAVEKLIVTLQSDQVEDVRKSAAVALGVIADRRAVTALITALADPYFGVRKTAGHALLQISPVPLEEIAAQARTLSGVGLGTAIETLGRSKNEQAAEYLLPFLTSHDPVVVGYTIDALADLATPAARQALNDMNTNSSPLFVRARRRHALEKLSAGD